MFMRAVFGAAVAAALVFVWGYVYWTMLPYSPQVMRAAESEPQLSRALQAALPESGMFVIPGLKSNDAAAVEDYQKRQAEGPIATVVFRREGSTMSAPVLGFGYLQMFLAALAAAIALSACDVNFYPGRVMIVFWMGIFATLWADFSDVAWFYYPMNYYWLKLGYTVPAAVLMGLVLGAFVRPPTASQASSPR